MSREVNSSLFCTFFDCEEDLLCDCFGTEYYYKLLADVKKYPEAVEYCPGEHEVGDIIKYHGCHFKRKDVSDSETDDPSPNCSDCWEKLDKFNTPCHNKIWPYICSYIAWSVFSDSIPFINVQVSATGLIWQKTDNEGGEGSDEKLYYSYVRSVAKVCKKKLKKLKDRILFLCDHGCEMFNEMLFVKSACTDECDPEDKVENTTAWKH